MNIFVGASGQSNILGGSAGSAGGDQTVNSRVFAWDPLTSAWVTATLGQSPFDTTSSPVRNNIAFNFCKKMQEEHDCDVYLVLSAKASQPISEWAAPSGAQWVALDASATAAKNDLGKPLDYFLWFQGEADAGDTNYKSDFLALRSAAISSGWMTAETPLIAGEIISDTALSKAALLGLLADRDATWFNMAMNENIEWAAGSTVHFSGDGCVQYGRGPFYAAAKQMPRMPSPYFREWIPVIKAAGSNPTVAYDMAETLGGSYRIGNLVQAWFKIKLTGISGGAGNVFVNGLPYPIGLIAPARADFMQTGIAAEVGGLSLNPASPIIIKTVSANGLKLLKVAGGGTTGLAVSDLSSTFTMCGSITYFVD
jgi:hypothetical protein